MRDGVRSMTTKVADGSRPQQQQHGGLDCELGFIELINVEVG